MCAGEKLCPSSQFRCANKYQCIEMDQVMDGVEDCLDLSDENIEFPGACVSCSERRLFTLVYSVNHSQALN